MTMRNLPEELRRYADTLDHTERPAIGEYDEASLFRAAAEKLERQDTALQVAKDDLERVAVEGDNFAGTIAAIDAARAYGETATGEK